MLCHRGLLHVYRSSLNALELQSIQSLQSRRSDFTPTKHLPALLVSPVCTLHTRDTKSSVSCGSSLSEPQPQLQLAGINKATGYLRGAALSSTHSDNEKKLIAEEARLKGKLTTLIYIYTYQIMQIILQPLASVLLFCYNI